VEPDEQARPGLPDFDNLRRCTNFHSYVFQVNVG